MGWIVLEIGLRCLRPLKTEPEFLAFEWFIFKFCGMGTAIELDETVQNLTK